MKVFLRKNVEKIGMAGEIIKVKEGFAKNYLIPHGLAVPVDKHNEIFYKCREKVVENRKVVISNQSSMLAEKIASLQVTLKRKMHDDGKLYGSVKTTELVQLLAKKGVSISKSQVLLDKAIKTKGTFRVTIKLSKLLLPTITLNVIAE